MVYVVSIRIEAAKNLLTSSDITISEIASLVGYDNSLYFSRLFTKHTGTSPTAYRNAHIKSRKSENELFNRVDSSKGKD